MAQFELHVTNYMDVEQVLNKLDLIIKQNEIMAKKSEEIKALQEEQKTYIANLSADLDRIATDIEGGLSADEAETVAADLRETNAKLKALADRNPETETPPVDPNV